MGLVAVAVALWCLGYASGFGPWGTVALIVSVMTAGYTMHQATNGLETGWAIAVAIGLIAAATSGATIAVGTLGGLLPWLRPDLSIVVAVLFVVTLWRRSPGTRVPIT